MKTSTKIKAIQLRKKGDSYSLIVEKLGVSKSTLSSWLKEIPYKPSKEVWERIQSGPLKSGMMKHNKKVADIARIKKAAKKELGIITERDLWMLGLGLYLGEGTKSYEIVRIINSDPLIVRMSIQWFKKICKLSNSNITIAIHLYPDNDIQESLTYWSKKVNIPLSQFRKTQVDRRLEKSKMKKRKLPHGTAHVTITSNGNPDFGVNLHRKIMGWVESSLSQV
ncbi:MAG: helix-turn-helix domain-containing protein [Candidatus Moranbacteria bacterium]|nr:helix-turn-helix domain-containing protein [Candidatus Moranbacteria bacterium]